MSALAKHDDAFSADQAQIIKQVLCPGISDAQLSMFGQVCKRTGLDPFARQIYATIRNANEGTRDAPKWVKKLTIQTGIDGFRLIAERTGKYAGQGAFEWCGKDGVWRDIWLESAPPAAARATVYRSDWERPIVRIARWQAYNQDNAMWKKMDAEQLAKCAEALCLRAAFPQDLSGLYTDDEMAQAESAPRNQTEVRATVVENVRPLLSSPSVRSAENQSMTHADTAERGTSATGGTSSTASETSTRVSADSWEARHERVWKLYANSSVVDQPITSISDDKLQSYIERLEKTLIDRRNEKTKQTALDAQPYFAAAVNERQIRERLKREAEAEMVGADSETGELPQDDLAAKLQQSIDRLQPKTDESDSNQEWGLVSPGATS